MDHVFFMVADVWGHANRVGDLSAFQTSETQHFKMPGISCKLLVGAISCFSNICQTTQVFCENIEIAYIISFLTSVSEPLREVCLQDSIVNITFTSWIQTATELYLNPDLFRGCRFYVLWLSISQPLRLSEWIFLDTRELSVGILFR